MSNGKILAIDDEPNIRHLITNEFSLEGFEVTTAVSGEEGLSLFGHQNFDVVLLDLKLPKISGLETLRRLRQLSPRAAVIMITGYGDIGSAVEAMKLGAQDYITKPFKLDELLSLVKQTVVDNQTEAAWPGDGRRPRAATLADLYLRCPSTVMQSVYTLIEKIAATDHTVLIQGETGSGKDVLAAQIHNLSLRKEGPFVTLDCGLLTRDLAESELYGHRKGAFSGASERKAGLVEQSNGGTLFLDEIGNVELDVQKKFLRFLETGRIRRVGETSEVRVDARIILATNLQLDEAMRQGKIRSDLFYRMAEFSIAVPPLRDRTEDILPLAQYFLERCGKQQGQRKFSGPAAELLLTYPWPGNIRELKSAINKIALLTDAATIGPEHLPPQLLQVQPAGARPSKSLEDMEKEHIMHVLAETGGNQTQASEILGINRKTLYKKIKKYKIFS